MQKIILPLLFTTVILTGCSGHSTIENDVMTRNNYMDTKGATTLQEEVNYDNNFREIDTTETDRKVEKSFNLLIETNKYDKDEEKLEKIVKENNGEIIGSSLNVDEDNRKYYNMTVRIKTENSDEFLNKVKKIGKLKSLDSSTLDRTDNYKDIESRLESSKKELKTLQELYKKAKTLEETMNINKEIVQVQNTIDNLTSQIKGIDKVTQYDTYYITLNEVVRYSDVDSEGKSISEEVKSAATDSIDLFRLALTFILVVLIRYWWLWLIVIFIIVFERKRKNKKEQDVRE